MKMEVSVYNLNFGSNCSMYMNESYYILIDFDEPVEYKNYKYSYAILHMVVSDLFDGKYNLSTDQGIDLITKDEAELICKNIYNHIDKFILVQPTTSVHDTSNIKRLLISDIKDIEFKNKLMEAIKLSIIEYNL